MPNLCALVRAICLWLKGKLQTSTPRHVLTIAMLPAEILLMIHELLPPASAASFVLCSRRLLEIFGNRSLVDLQSDDLATERRRFLSRLDRDLPDLLLCYRCCVLHPVKSVLLPREIKFSFKGPQCVHGDGYVKIMSTIMIRYSYAQLIMRNHRLGRCTKTLMRQLSHVYRASWYSQKFEHRVQGSIINHELVINVLSKRYLYGNWDFRRMTVMALSICTHAQLHENEALLQAFTHRARYSKVSPPKETKDTVDQNQWHECDQCPTRYTFTIREPAESTIEVRTEIRRNLGSCRTPFDPIWLMQMSDLHLRVYNPTEAATLWTPEARDDVPEEANQCTTSHPPDPNTYDFPSIYLRFGGSAKVRFSCPQSPLPPKQSVPLAAMSASFWACDWGTTPQRQATPSI